MSTGQQDDAPWYMKYGARGLGTAGGLIAMGLGLLNCITLTAWCLVAGIYQIFAGFIVVSAEAPCCCMFIDFVQHYSSFVESRPKYQKAALYVILSIPGIVMCQSVSIFFGSGLIFVTGVLYGMMALGKKSPKEAMLEAAGRVRFGGGGSAGMEPIPATMPDSAGPPQTAVYMDDTQQQQQGWDNHY